MMDVPISETDAKLPDTIALCRVLWWVFLTLFAFAAAIAVLLSSNALVRFKNGAPPVEDIAFECFILAGTGIRAVVRGGVSKPMTTAQVSVDDTYCKQFTQEPPGPGVAWRNWRR